MILFSLVFHCVILLLIAYTAKAKNSYEILNLTTTHFTDGELKQKYRALAKKYHPDKFRNKANMSDINAKFLEITNAFEMLRATVFRKIGFGVILLCSKRVSNMSHQFPFV